jgi:hypothetical protein
MAEAIYIPIIVIVYLILMIWYSTIMAKVLNTNLAILIIVGIFIPPLWLIFAIISLAYQANDTRVTPASPKTKSPKTKTPKKAKKK